MNSELQSLTREGDVLWQRLEDELSVLIRLARMRARTRRSRQMFIQYAKTGGPSIGFRADVPDKTRKVTLDLTEKQIAKIQRILGNE
jgi:hypothetical protein